MLTKVRSPSDTKVVSYTYRTTGFRKAAITTIDLNNSIGIPLTASFTSNWIAHSVAGEPQAVIHESGIRTATYFQRAGFKHDRVRVFREGAYPLQDDEFEFERNVAGAPTRLKHSSKNPSSLLGRIVDFTYDNVGRVTLAESNDAVADQISQAFTYSGTSEVTAMTSSVGSLVSARAYAFDYDDRHQLTDASDDQGYSAAFTFGRTGTLQSSFVAATSAPGQHVYPRDVDYEYADPTASSGHTDPEMVLELLDSTSGQPMTSYTYDDAGSMTARTLNGDTMTFRYDGDQRMRKRILSDGISETYHYTDGARWLSATNSEGTFTKVRLWLGDVEVIYSCTASSCAETETRTTIRLGGRAVARINQDPADNRTTELLHTNGLGHLLGVYSFFRPPTGPIDYTLEAAFQYGPFGEILESAAASGSSTEDYLQRFNGKEFDLDSGLSYYGYRYYEPVGQVWNRSDPLYRFASDSASGSARRGNLYSFTGNNPMRFVDLDGLDIRTDVRGAYERSLRHASSVCGGIETECYAKLSAKLHSLYLGLLQAIDAAEDSMAKKSAKGRRAAKKGRAINVLSWNFAPDEFSLEDPCEEFDADCDMGVDRVGPGGQRLAITLMTLPWPWISFFVTMSQASNHDEAAAVLLAFSAGAVVADTAKLLGASSRSLCFVAGTMVKTDRGLRAIEEIEIGDLVWSRDDQTDEESWKTVLRTSITPDQRVLELVLIEADGDEQRLRITPEHPLWTRAGWLAVGELGVGESVWARDGWAVLSSVRYLDRQENVYNFEVADFHSYFVGEGGVWAHNGLCDDLSAAAAVLHKKSKDLTRAGNSLKKHSIRPNSVFTTTETTGSAISRQAQQYVDDILTTPGSTFTKNKIGGYDVRKPPGPGQHFGPGVRYDANGDFVGFRQPN